MGRNLRGMKNAGQQFQASPNAANAPKPKPGQPSYEDVQDVVSRYQNSSDQELMGELMRMTQGVSSYEMKHVVNQLSPMLNPAQRMKLSQIIQQIKN